MDQTILLALGLCAVCGGLGGLLGRVIPNGVKKDKVAGAPLEAGWMVSILLGGVAAVFALVGTEPLASSAVFTPQHAGQEETLVLTWRHLVSSTVVGLGGVGWLIATQNTRTLKTALVEASLNQPDENVAAIAVSSPRQALSATRESAVRDGRLPHVAEDPGDGRV